MANFDSNVKITATDSKLLEKHPEVIGLLQKAYNNEFLTWLVYEHGMHFVYGPWRESIINHFEEHATEEEEHAEWIGQRLAALGEEPVVDMRALKRVTSVSHDFVKLIEFIMQLEGEAVALYSKILPLLEENAAMRAKIEEIVSTEQEHFEDFEKMIRVLPVLQEKQDNNPTSEVQNEPQD